MEKTKTILGIIGVIILTIGAVIKLSHGHGGISIIAIGALFLAIYVFLYMLEQVKTSTTRLTKAYYLLFCISGLFMVLGFPLELMRFKGTILFFVAFFIAFFGLLIVSFLRVIKEKDQKQRYTYIDNFIFLLGGGILLLYPSILWILDRIPGNL